jgi:carboxymethylenebutenolidase
MDTALTAETVHISGSDGDVIEAYAARPLAATKRGGIALIHHLPGYDRETKVPPRCAPRAACPTPR